MAQEMHRSFSEILFAKNGSTQRDIEKPLLGINKSHNGTDLNPSIALLLSTYNPGQNYLRKCFH